MKKLIKFYKDFHTDGYTYLMYLMIFSCILIGGELDILSSILLSIIFMSISIIGTYYTNKIMTKLYS